MTGWLFRKMRLERLKRLEMSPKTLRAIKSPKNSTDKRDLALVELWLALETFSESIRQEHDVACDYAPLLAHVETILTRTYSQVQYA